jgi:hypothetical protein
MVRRFPRSGTGILVCAVMCVVAVCGSWTGLEARENTVNQQNAVRRTAVPQGLEGIWDPARYISVDEIKSGMEAYCLTVYKGTAVEKFGVEVLSVVHDFMPGRDAILVRGTDERFIHTGPVAGCSGSPVYIDGRLAGALATGWQFSKDPLYGVTPIADMLRSGSVANRAGGEYLNDGLGLALNFSRPIDFAQIEKKILSPVSSSRAESAGASVLPCPIVVSGMPESVTGDLDESLRPLGFMVVSGAGGGGRTDVCDIKPVPGACLTLPLVTGDITIDVVGTITEVRGDEIYAFGHSFLGYGPVDLPMAMGEVHTVVSSVIRSFKVGTSANVIGALRADESTAVRGKIGAEARMIPLTVNVSRYNDSRPRKYNCRIADNRMLTPRLLRVVVASAGLFQGEMPPDNTVSYKGTIETDGAGTIVFDNVSTGEGLNEAVRDTMSPLGLLMNNPYRQVRIKSINVDLDIREKDISSAIWSVGLSGSRVKRGDNLDVEVVTESVRSQKQKYNFNFTIPENTPVGTYQLIICGGFDYADFLRKAVPHRYVPENFDTMVGVINRILAVGRDELHCVLVLPAGGVALEQAELPELPATKAMVLGDARRANTMQTFPGWIEKSVRTSTIITDKKIMNVTVEQ